MEEVRSVGLAHAPRGGRRICLRDFYKVLRTLTLYEEKAERGSLQRFVLPRCLNKRAIYSTDANPSYRHSGKVLHIGSSPEMPETFISVRVLSIELKAVFA